MLKWPLRMVSCLPDGKSVRLKSALVGIGKVTAASDRSALVRIADRVMPDAIVFDPRYAFGPDAQSEGDASVPGRMHVPLLAWWDEGSLVAPSHIARRRAAAWFLGGPAEVEPLLRDAVLETCAAVPQQLAMAIEHQLASLPPRVGRELHAAMSWPTESAGREAWVKLGSMLPSTLRRHLLRASLASLDRLARVSRIAVAFRHLRFESGRVAVAATQAGYASERTLRENVRHEFGCTTMALGALSCGEFVARAASAIAHRSPGLDATGT